MHPFRHGFNLQMSKVETFEASCHCEDYLKCSNEPIHGMTPPQVPNSSLSSQDCFQIFFSPLNPCKKKPNIPNTKPMRPEVHSFSVECWPNQPKHQQPEPEPDSRWTRNKKEAFLRKIGRFCISRGSSEFFIFRDRSKKRGDREEERFKRGIQFERRKGREAPRHATVHSSPIRKPTRSSSSARAEN
jgi:hypothetical protein